MDSKTQRWGLRSTTALPPTHPSLLHQLCLVAKDLNTLVDPARPYQSLIAGFAGEKGDTGLNDEAGNVSDT
jgi:hypothetical protein